MAIALAQTQTATNFATTCAAVWASNTVTGNLIVVCVGSNGQAVSGIADTQGNTYTKIDSGANGGAQVELWYAKNITGGTTPTVTVTLAGSTWLEIVIREYSGLDTVAPLDQHLATTGNSATPSSGNVTTVNASELLVGWCGVPSSGAAYTAGAGYGNVQSIGNTFDSCCLEDQIVSATGTYAGTFSIASSSWVCGVATFSAAVASTPTSAQTFNNYQFVKSGTMSASEKIK